MKLKFFLLAIAATFFLACSQDKPSGELAEATFRIDGMTCAMGCAKTIEDRLADLVGVTSVSIDFEKESGRVTYSRDNTSKEAIIYEVQSTNGGDKYVVSNYKVVGPNAGQSKGSVEIDSEKEDSPTKIYIPKRVSFPNIFRLFLLR